ncbi:unnamed protein product, partial [Symbiodinium sp. KB8]
AKEEKPGIVASKLRKETIKPWTALQTSVKNALVLGPEMLKECLGEYANEEEAMAQEQPWPVCAIQTLGQMTHIRGTVLELQGTAAAVSALGEIHKTAIEILQTISSAVCAEVSSWRSSIKALKKARELEEAALRREEDKLKKQARLKKKAEDAKAARELAKKQKDEEKAQKASKEKEDAEDPAVASKRRKKPTAPAGQVNETDPLLLQSLVSPEWPMDYIMPVFDSCEEMAKFIVRTSGMLACKTRLRRSSIKKACPGYNDKRMHRKVASDVAEFASDFEAKLKGAAEGFTKQVRLVEAPAAEMALDALILETADNACCRDLQFLSREDMGKRFSECGEDDAAKDKSGLRWRGMALAASKVGSLFAGFSPVGMPSMYHHILNEKLVCVVDLDEAIEWYCQVSKIDRTAADFVAPSLKDL